MKPKRKPAASNSKDVVHAKLGSLSKLIKGFKNRPLAARFASRIAKECQPDAGTREFLVRLLAAAAADELGKSRFATQDLNLAILRFLLKDDFTSHEVPHLLQFLNNYSSARHISDTYDAEIDELFSLPDRRLITFLDLLLNHEMQPLRESAIELLEVAWDRNRLHPWIVNRVAAYRKDNPKRSSLEDAYLQNLIPRFEGQRTATKKKNVVDNP
jgi:hypothetical protein